MDFERIAMLLNIFHMTVGEPSFKTIHTKAREELVALSADRVDSDAVDVNPNAPADPTHPETVTRRV